MSNNIHKELTISEIFSRYPHRSSRLAQELTNEGLNCVGCGAATYETLEAGMLSHGFTNERIEKVIGRLNAILEEESDPTTITLTEGAAKRFLKILAEENKLGWALRLGDRPGGCNGYEHFLDFSENANDDDRVLESHGVAIHIQEESFQRLVGSEIDYSDGLYASGFKVSNPNAKSSCSCGTSHNY